jgi:DnaK suppressor protein
MPNPELDPEQIERLRSALETHRDELEALLKNGAGAAEPVTLDQQSVGRVSRIDAIQQQQIARAQQQIARAGQQQAAQTLGRVDLALKRIAGGEYGYCLQCGEPVGYARLGAQPFATLCLDCQEASETR